MAKFVHSDVLDNGLNGIKNAATKMILISAYTAGDSYATVTAAALCTVTMAPGDFTLASSGSSRTVTSAAKSGTASGSIGGTPDLHIAFTNGVDKVLWVTDETTNQPITVNNTINFPTFTYSSNQPT